MVNSLIKDLKKFSYSENSNLEKKVVNHFELRKKRYVVGVVTNYICSKDVYEVYTFINNDNDICSGLLRTEHLEKKQASSVACFHKIFLRLLGYRYFVIKMIKKTK